MNSNSNIFVSSPFTAQGVWSGHSVDMSPSNVRSAASAAADAASGYFSGTHTSPFTQSSSNRFSFSPYLQFSSLSDTEDPTAQTAESEAVAPSAMPREQPQSEKQPKPKRNASRKRSRQSDEDASEEQDESSPSDAKKPRGAGRRVPHIAKACAACRKSHTSCDGVKPCKRCVKLGIVCEDPQETGKKRGRPRKQASQQEASPVETAASAPSSSSSSPSDSQSQTFMPQQSDSIPTDYSEILNLLGQHDDAQPPSEASDRVQTHQQDYVWTSPSPSSSSFEGDPRDEEVRRLRLELLAAQTRIQGLQRRLDINDKYFEEYLSDGQDVPLFIAGHFGRLLLVNEALRVKLNLLESNFLDAPLTWNTFVEPSFVPIIFLCIKSTLDKQENFLSFHAPMIARDGRRLQTFVEAHITYDNLAKDTFMPLFIRARVHFLD